MRELKFRAWNPKSKTMWDNVGYHPHNAERHDDGSMTIAPFLDVPIMQYTGLKDKNGKEIYEGDIVSNHYMNQNKICSISFKEGCFIVNYKNQIHPISEHFCNENDCCAWLEIIGNTYESPHLLAPETTTTDTKQTTGRSCPKGTSGEDGE